MIDIAPSILAADFSDLKNQISLVKNADYLHLDVMDGNFVPNITFGPKLISAIRPHSSLLFDTHLMINHPEKYISAFAEAGSDLITVHVEAEKHLHSLIQQINKEDCLPGAALNPATPLDELEYVLPDLKLVLIMSVNPGFGGQKFISGMYNKIKRLKDLISSRNPEVKIAVDGGIKPDNVKKVASAGADIIVAGSAIFKAESPEQALKEFKMKTNGG